MPNRERCASSRKCRSTKRSSARRCTSSITFRPILRARARNAPEYSKLQGVPFVGRRTGQDVRFDQDGNVWLTDRSYPHRLVKLDPRTGEQKDYVLPDPKNGIHEVMVDPSRHDLVAGTFRGPAANAKRLLAFNPKSQKFEQMIPGSRQRHQESNQMDAVDRDRLEEQHLRRAGSWAGR